MGEGGNGKDRTEAENAARTQGHLTPLYSGFLIVDPHGMRQLSPQYFVIRGRGRHFASLTSYFSSSWTPSVSHKVVQVGAPVSGMETGGLNLDPNPKPFPRQPGR